MLSVFSIRSRCVPRGFTIVEVMTAVTILVVGVLAIISIATYSNSVANLNAQRLVAAHLAEEGIELVRNIRDTNYVSGATKFCSTSASNNPATDCTACSAWCSNWDRYIHLPTNGTGAAYIAQYTLTTGLAGVPICQVGTADCPTNPPPALSYNSASGLYGYNGWGGFTGLATTPAYTRVITIAHQYSGAVPSILVTSTVTWTGTAGTHQVVLQELLYDWRPN